MSSAWDMAGLLPVAPPEDMGAGDVVVTGQGTYWECGLTDWHLMLGWFAGPGTLLRYPDTRAPWWQVTETDAAGDRRTSERRFTDEEQREHDAEINELLQERGIPDRPGGFRWFQLVPPGGTGRDVTAAYTRVQSELPERYDVARETAYTRAAIEELYGLPVTPPPPIPPEAWEPEPEDPHDAERRRTEEAQVAEAMTGPPGAVPILGCRDLQRTLRFYAALDFEAEELAGYAILRNGTTELHISRHTGATPGACLIRIPDAAALWHRIQGRDGLEPLDAGNPGMVQFTLRDPDGNYLRFISGRVGLASGS